jgi:hypothetical protein
LLWEFVSFEQQGVCTCRHSTLKSLRAKEKGV